MRLWSIHPKYLDAKGLVALWREALLAQKVLVGKTRGYVNHPQLIRFKRQNDPIAAIGYYLKYVYKEAKKRGYRFKKEKILCGHKNVSPISVSSGQVLFEFGHLMRKIKNRSVRKVLFIKVIKLHPLFRIKKGKVAPWERAVKSKKL